ncbi:hypothetical protein F4778DRAFT_755090 [Xylariomycetidae sp. FL2044]|nr:hypothetical protein F4778DRAFT_755090 [Xylariomycetidae sp. FL2044]
MSVMLLLSTILSSFMSNAKLGVCFNDRHQTSQASNADFRHPGAHLGVATSWQHSYPISDEKVEIILADQPSFLMFRRADELINYVMCIITIIISTNKA